MPAYRAQDASCAICMDSLFNSRDDLDDIIPITAPDCGHVFHEPCLTNWFQMQAKQFVARMRDQGERFRSESPTIDDAPAECPSCRTECYADPETNQPMLHRLYINFGDGMPGSSQAHPPSSPGPGPSTQRWRAKKEHGLDTAAMGISRRAKDVGGEFQALGPDSSEEDVAGAMRRAEGLEGDTTTLSTKSSTALKKYIGGLTVAINKLRTELETHPLIPELRLRVAQLEEANELQVRQMIQQERVGIPGKVKQALEVERRKHEKALKAVEQQREVIQRELEKEQVGRTAFRRAMREREAELERRVEGIQETLRKEQEDRVSLTAQLAERTKLVKVYQTKAENRKKLQVEVEQLKVENDRLRREAAAAYKASTSSAVPTLVPASFEDAENDGRMHSDLEVEMDELDDDEPHRRDSLSRSTASASTYATRKRPASADESLVVDIPPLDIDFDGPSVPKRSNTARTFTFELDEGRVRRGDREGERDEVRSAAAAAAKKKKQDLYDTEKQKRRAALEDDRRVAASRRDLESDGRSSKYFRRPAVPSAVINSRAQTPEPEVGESSNVLVAASSPGSPPLSPAGPSRTSTGPVRTSPSVNPFMTPAPAPRAPARQPPAPSPDVIDLVSSSPPSAQRLRPRQPPPQPQRDRERTMHRSVSGSSNTSVRGALPSAALRPAPAIPRSASGADFFANLSKTSRPGGSLSSVSGLASASASSSRMPLAFSGAGNSPAPPGAQKARSTLEFLGVADDKGRPTKGAAFGSKMKRRA